MAAIHYKKVVGEPQDNDLPRTMSINMFHTKLAVMGLTKEKLMIDSGAQCCVCPLNYAPEIETVKVDRRELPELHSVTGAAMRIAGVKYVTYQLAGHHEMTVRYYVTDVGGPILSVNGLNKTGYSPVLSESPYLLYYKDYITKLEKDDGLYYNVSYGKHKYEGPTA